MMDSIFQIGVSNACISFALAIAALTAGIVFKRPHLTYLLWLLVLIKMLTPPLMIVPVFTVSTDTAVQTHSMLVGNAVFGKTTFENNALTNACAVLFDWGTTWFPFIWLTGSVLFLFFSIHRIWTFHNLLMTQSITGNDDLASKAKKIARQLELKSVPKIHLTHAHISPMVWWTGGSVHIFIPSAIYQQMNQEDCQWILAHELAHVKRGDYVVRWIEWLACVWFWWNPVVWWAQRNLREMEEICCDALVLSAMQPKPCSYANSLLQAVEYLAQPAIRPPTMASEINSGGILHRRFKMIVSNPPYPAQSRWMQAWILLLAVTVLPFGISYAQYDQAKSENNGEQTIEQAGVRVQTLRSVREQDGNYPTKFDPDVYVKRIRAAVEAGKITPEEAREKLIALRKRTANSKSETVDKKPLTHEDYERIEANLKKAVTEGKMSARDARTRLFEMRHIVNNQSQHADDIHWDNIKQRIEHAVESGTLTREEANAKYREIRIQNAAKNENLTRD